MPCDQLTRWWLAWASLAFDFDSEVRVELGYRMGHSAEILVIAVRIVA